VPKFVYLDLMVPCPTCGRDVTCDGPVGFQWGYCDAPGGSMDARYRIGDAIVWRADADGRVPAWRYFHDGSGNIGDPRCLDLDVRENEHGISACRHCGQPFGAIEMHIRRGTHSSTRSPACVHPG
jgi:hypothetical protein